MGPQYIVFLFGWEHGVWGSKRYIATVTSFFEAVLEKQTFYGQRVFKFKFIH
jgi:hypothetical protein